MQAHPTNIADLVAKLAPHVGERLRPGGEQVANPMPRVDIATPGVDHPFADIRRADLNGIKVVVGGFGDEYAWHQVRSVKIGGVAYEPVLPAMVAA